MYIVYEVLYNGVPVYYGSGKVGREKHVTSGRSSSPDLNKLYFNDPSNIRVNILRDNLTKEESLQLEKEYIDAIQPLYNKQYKRRKYARFHTL